MQSIFRLPALSNLTWPSGMEQVATAPYNAHSVDLSSTGNVNKAKRKRIESSPRSSPLPTQAPKKMKPTMTVGGAAPGVPEQYIHSLSVIAPKPVNASPGPGLTAFITGDRVAAAAVKIPSPSPLATPTPTRTYHMQQAAAMGIKPLAGSRTMVPPHAVGACLREEAATPKAPAVAAGKGTQSIGLPPINSQPVHYGSNLLRVQPVAAAAVLAASQPPPAGPDMNLKIIEQPPVTAGAQSYTPPAARSREHGFSSGSAVLLPLQVDPSAEQTVPTRLQDHNVPVAAPKAIMSVNTDHLRAIVEVEINQAILFKHNELRLIDQEMAKCQVALEQLRRCQLIPFPGVQEIDMRVAMHSAPALVAPNGMTIPREPAPWGVTDGPYTRHYASWLIPSPLFDPHAPEVMTPGASPYPRDGRVTRGSGIDVTPTSAVYPSSRSARATGGRGRSSLEAQLPMQQRDPLVIKRIQDGQWVKLYCSECKPERSDFANVQGFLNHCRISHKLDYKSHEAAAIACGRVVQINESAVVPEPLSAREAAPKASFPVPCSYSDRPVVHPLIKGSMKNREMLSPLQQIVPRSYSTPTARKGSGLSTPTTPTPHSSFKAAAETPYLSKLMAQRGFAGDFGCQVSETKRKVDLSVYSDSESEPEMPNIKKPQTGKMKGPVASGRVTNPKSLTGRQMKPTQASGMKPSTQRPVVPSLPPLVPFGLSPVSSSLPTPEIASADVDLQLSPNTSESNPGLVSDRDEEYDEDEMDVDVASNPSPRPDSEVNVKIKDGEDEEVEETASYCAARGPNAC
jgi:ADA HAT complex component 1